MHTMKISAIKLACLAAIFHAGSALAMIPTPTESFDIRYESKEHALTTQLNLPIGGTRGYIVGNYNFEMRTLGNTPSTTSFVGYCVDPFQWASSSFHEYGAMLLEDFLDASRFQQVAKLFGHAYEDSLMGSTQAAGFQLALWEVFNDDGRLDQGAVRVTGTTNNAVRQSAQTLLDSLASWTGNGTNYELTFYQNATHQDYLAVTGPLSPTPEPESYALLLAGLGLIGLVARRRATQDVA
jgi:hypothetical protein